MVLVATKSRCGSCNCNELSPPRSHRRNSGNRFSSLRCGPMTIMLATLMIFSYVAEAVDSDIVTSHNEELELTIQDSVKNEIEMELDQGTEKANVVLPFEYPDKEIGNNVVTTQSDSDSPSIVDNGETVREVRNLHEDLDKNIDLALADEQKSSEEEVQSVEKREKVEEPQALASQSSGSSSQSSESENAAEESVETSENLIEKDANDVVQKPEGTEETEKQNQDNGEQLKPEIQEEEAKSSSESESVSEQGVGGEPIKEESLKEEPLKEEGDVKEDDVKVEAVKEETVKEEPVKEEVVKEEPVKEEPVEGLVPGKVAADDEAPEIPLDIEENIIDDEADSEDQKPKPIEVSNTLIAPSDIAEFQPTPETSNAEEPAKTETLASPESSNALLPNIDEEQKEEVAATEKTADNSETPLDEQPIQEDSNEEVLSVVLNENATILESSQSPSFEPEQVVPIKVEETAVEQTEVEDEPVPPQEPEHTVIKKQGVDLQQEEEGQEDDTELAEGTSRPEEEADSANAIQGVDPEVKKDQQEVGEQESEVKKEEQEVAVQQVESEVKDEPTPVTGEQQEVKVVVPEVKEEEPEVKVGEAEVKEKEPEEEPKVNVEEPVVKEEEPSVKVESEVQTEQELKKDAEVKEEDNQIPNETDLGEVPEEEDNIYDEDEEVGQPDGEVTQNEAQPTAKEPEIVPAAEEKITQGNEVKQNQVADEEKQDKPADEEKQDEPAIEEEQEEAATEPAVVETEGTIAAFTSEKSSSLVSEESPAATIFESFQPRDAGQRFNNHVLTAESGMGKALETRSINETPTYRSSVIIALCSGVAVLFVLISITIFIISFQRQHGTLDIEMQEKRCGKDDRDDDPESCLKLLDIELPITMLPTAVVVATSERTTPKTSMIIMEEQGEGEEAVPMNTSLQSDDIDETL